ncbi:MAG: glycoside hydrolase family 44 protein [Pseudomonadota bacterium]
MVSCSRAPAEETALAPASITRPARIDAAAMIYDGALASGWQDWGWGTHELGKGAARLNLSNYGGWILWKQDLSGPFGGVSFRLRAPAAFGNFLQVRLLETGQKEPTLPAVDIGPQFAKALPDGWVEIFVPWNLLNPGQKSVDRLQFNARSQVAADWVEFDKVMFTRFDVAAEKAAQSRVPARPVQLAVDCKAPGQPISPYIYGVAGGGDKVWGNLQTASRWGGNRTSRYNWQTGDTNTGSDWFFENHNDGGYTDFLDRNRKYGLRSAITIPMIGWIAKDAQSSGFPVAKFGPQKATDQWRADAGNGERADGTPLQPGPPTGTSVPAPPELMARWVAAMLKDDKGSKGAHVLFLDNEPELWNHTHRDVHPEPLTYDELLDRTIRYGTAIRGADPGALIAGPSAWGWSAYSIPRRISSQESGTAPDRHAHGDMPLLPWYLAQLADHEKRTGQHLLDILDLHYYPQAQGVYSDAADGKTAALRIRSTRSLWDPTYRDESWINDTVQLIPRMKEWVAKNHPGLATSLGEYNFGAEKDISGGLAQAEALGRFGTTGLDYAFYWTVPPENSPAYWAFRAYRNFDGKGARFLDRSLPTRMASGVSLFASRDESGKHLVLIALNLGPDAPVEASIALDGCAPLVSHRSFSYGQFSKAMEAQDEVAGAQLKERLAPYSINVFDLTF